MSQDSCQDSSYIDDCYAELACRVASWSGNSVEDIPREALETFQELLDAPHIAGTVPAEYQGRTWGASRRYDEYNSLSYVKHAVHIHAIDQEGNAMVEKIVFLTYEDADASEFVVMPREGAFALVLQHRREANCVEVGQEDEL